MTVRLNKRVLLSPEFLELWGKIKQKTTYRVSIDTEELVKRCVKALREMPKLQKTRLVLETKGTTNLFDLRTPEQLKIHCGQKHFEALDDVEQWPEPVTDWGQVKKLDLIQAINEALEYADDRESFIANMEVEGYQVRWEPNRKHITFTCPNGRKCRDSSLHDETFLKENLEMLFIYRQATGFQPCTQEPDEGWLGELAAGWFRVAADLERDEQWQLPAPPTWTDSKQRRREALKKMAMGQKFGSDHVQEQTM